jgi:prepilin-type N-terminal cleavage/methylation domain-containing protein
VNLSEKPPPVWERRTKPVKNQNNAGYSLIEVLVAILLLGILSVPLCNSLVLGHKMNVKSQTLLQAQLEVSAAVETLMAEGITEPSPNYDMVPDGNGNTIDRFPGVTVVTKEAKVTVKTVDDAGNEQNTEITIPSCYEVIVTSERSGSVSVTTFIRKAGGTA